MVTKKDVLDGATKIFKTAADLAETTGQKAGETAKTITDFHSWATDEVARKIAASACDSLEIAAKEVRSRGLSKHPVTITTTISLGPAEVVMSVQLAPVDPVEQDSPKEAEA